MTYIHHYKLARTYKLFTKHGKFRVLIGSQLPEGLSARAVETTALSMMLQHTVLWKKPNKINILSHEKELGRRSRL